MPLPGCEAVIEDELQLGPLHLTPEACCLGIQWALVSDMSMSPRGRVQHLPTPYTHTLLSPCPQPVTAVSVMNDSAVGPSKRTGGHKTNHSCQALIFPWESHLHPPHPSLGTGLPLYPTHTQNVHWVPWTHVTVHEGSMYTGATAHAQLQTRPLSEKYNNSEEIVLKKCLLRTCFWGRV